MKLNIHVKFSVVHLNNLNQDSYFLRKDLLLYIYLCNKFTNVSVTYLNSEETLFSCSFFKGIN